MRQKNRIALKMITVVLTVSFLHPFGSMILCAEEATQEMSADVSTVTSGEERETMQQAEQTEKADSGQEEKPGAESETERQEETAEAQQKDAADGQTAEPCQEADADGQTEEPCQEADADEEVAEPRQEAETDGEVAEPCREEDADGEAAESCQEEEDGNKTAELQTVAVRNVMALRTVSDTGIDRDDPEAGQSDTFGYTGREVQWLVPVSGYYDIYCYGAAGGSGDASQKNPYSSKNYASASGGSGGASRASRAFLRQGMTLTLHVGGVGGNGTCDTYRGDEQPGSGGYSDGGKGSGHSTICENDDNHNGSCASGGGGGSTYILLEGSKIISAAGGKGGNASYKCSDGSGSAGGGSGGGSNVLTGIEGLVWQTDELDEKQSGVNSGYGYIRLTIVKVMPFVSLEASSSDWTNGNIELTAVVKSEGSGLGDAYLSWERAEDGSDLWTDSLTYTVDQNGTYTCKIRDVDGNVGTAEIRVDNIDRLKPSAEITSAPEWTREPVALTVCAEDRAATDEYGCSGLAEEAYLWGRNGERQEAEIWSTDVTYMADTSGSYFCKVRDQAGNIRKVDYYVGCIDVTAPSATMTADQTKPTWKDVVLTVTASDTGIGLAQMPYCWEQDENGDDIWTEENTLVADQNGLYHCKVRDALDNMIEVTCLVNNIDRGLKDKDDSHGGSHSHGGGGGSQSVEQDQMRLDELLTDEFLPPVLEVQEEEEQWDEKHDGSKAKANRTGREDADMLRRLQELLGMADGEPEIVEEEIVTPIRPTLSPETFSEAPQHKTVQKDGNGKRFFGDTDIRTVILYSVWLVVVLCGLAWLLFSLLFEHVTVYRADRKGKFQKAGRLTIIRKKDYRQVNLTPLQDKKEDRQYKLRFSLGFAYVNRKEKILIRTYHGVELRNVNREIIV